MSDTDILQPLNFRLVEDGLELSFDECFTLSHEPSGESLSFRNTQVNVFSDEAMEKLLALLLDWKEQKRQTLLKQIEDAQQLQQEAYDLEEKLQAELAAEEGMPFDTDPDDDTPGVEDNDSDGEDEPATPDAAKLREALRQKIQEHIDEANQASDLLLVTLGHNERESLRKQMKEHLAHANELASQYLDLCEA